MGAKVSAETPPRTVLNLHSLYGFAHMRVQAHADMGGKVGSRVGGPGGIGGKWS